MRLRNLDAGYLFIIGERRGIGHGTLLNGLAVVRRIFGVCLLHYCHGFGLSTSEIRVSVLRTNKCRTEQSPHVR